MLYDCIRCGKYIATGSIVLFQLDNLRILIFLLKVQDIGYIRSSELVYGLIIVSHHTQVPVFSRKHLDQQKLYVISILILVNHDISESILICIKDIRIVLEQLHRLVNKIVKVHRIVLLKTTLILSVHLCSLCSCIVCSILFCKFIR